ncbi:MAG: sigma 54-interacting transcriptional regulator [Desulfomonile tiedjei]|nr:sigma 54-interacting transcriptional regulator [Desulfomonile tiedjei]
MTGRKRILAVDDDPKNRNLLKHMLESLDYEPELAGSGSEALEKLGSGIDLVLLDVMMPGMDGFEVARRIRSDPFNSDIPIIVVTILTGKEDRLRAVESGANDFISKPIDKLELRVRLTSLLKMKEAQDAIKRHRDELEEMVARRTAALQESERRCRTLYEDSKRREELYHSFLTASADAVVIYDTQGRTQYVSPSFTRTFGWDLSEVESKLLPYVPDAEKQGSQEQVDDVIRKGATVSGFVTKRSTKDGRVLDMSISASRYMDHRGDPAGMLVVLHDITEHKRMDQALRESEARFRNIFEAAQDCIFLKDRSLSFTDVNPAMLEMLEMPFDGLIGKTDEELFGEDYAVQARNLEARVLEGQTIETEQTLKTKSGPVVLDCIRFPIRDSSGEITGVCGIARDMTERARTTHEAAHRGEEYPANATRSALELVRLAAKTDSIVLFLGESGSGKDHFARHLHELSQRANGPFFSINCAALPQDLAESELFGHEPGAFTGSAGRKRGLLELAEGGSLLLNEIGELSPRLQAKLLTFLDTQSFTRVGGEKSIKVNARLMAATNRDLEKEVETGNFREDLFYRLSVFVIKVPPLRRRTEDIPIIARDLVHLLVKRIGLLKVPVIEPAAMVILTRYDWPGNVRELRNVLERALILCRHNRITPEDIGISPKPGVDPGKDDMAITLNIAENTSLGEVLHETKRLLVTRALHRCRWNVTAAARLLGVSRDSLRHHMEFLSIRRGE